MLMHMSTKARLTSEDLWRISPTDHLIELINGEIVEMPPAGCRHGELIIKLGRRLLEQAERSGIGKVVGGETGFVLNLPYDHERVRGADVAFISNDRLPGGKLPEKFLRGAPDLAVEILSPSDSADDIQQKVQDYIKGGARIVWVISPQAKCATVYRPDGSARLVRENESLCGEDVLPGLSIALPELFQT